MFFHIQNIRMLPKVNIPQNLRNLHNKQTNESENGSNRDVIFFKESCNVYQKSQNKNELKQIRNLLWNSLYISWEDKLENMTITEKFRVK